MRSALRRRGASTGRAPRPSGGNSNRVIPCRHSTTEPRCQADAARCGKRAYRPQLTGVAPVAEAPGTRVAAMPLLLPDPAELRALAGRIDAHARATRGRADRLRNQLAATDWRGLAARPLDGPADLTLHGLRGAAGRLDDAADALRRHADNVGWLVDTVRAIVRLGLGTMDELLSLSAGELLNVADDFGAGLRAGLSAGVHGVATV